MKKNQDNPQKVFERLNSLVNLVLGAVNTTAGKALYDARDMLVKDKKLYRFEVKRAFKGALKAYDEYEKRHMANFGDRYQLFLDYLDSIEDEIQPHIFKMRMSFKQVLDKNNIPNSNLKSQLETARTLAEYACCIYDRLLSDTKQQSGYDFDKYMRPARLTAVFHYIDEVCKSVYCQYKDFENDVDFNKDKNCIMAFKIIESKLTSEATLNKAGYEALDLNPDMIKEIASNDYDMLKEKYSKKNN